MSKTTTVCRACLVDNLTMYRVTDSPYEEIYEKLSNAKLGKGNLPETFCYLCINMLKKFNKFAALTQESNAILEQWYKNEIDCKPKKHQQFKISTTSVEYITSNITYAEQSKEIKIKIEPDDAEGLNQVQYTEFTNESDPYAAPEETADINVDDPQVKDDDSFTDDPKPGTPSDDEFEVPIVKLESRKRVKTEKTPKGPPSKIRRQTTSTHRPAHTDGETKAKELNTFEIKDRRKVLNTYTCGDCDYKTTQKADIMRHLKIHVLLKQCDQCDFKSRNESVFKKHQLKRHGKPHECDKCNYKSNKKSCLNQHLRVVHTNEKPFLCHQCDYRCNLSAQLKKHLVKHSDLKPFACDKCQYKTKNKRQLKIHSVIHTGIKPFSCDVCGFRACTKTRLKCHIITHSGERPFACDRCDFKAAMAGTLTQHMKIHTGEKPFTCNFCNYACAQKGTLKDHLLKHTKEKPFLCDQCDFKCGLKAELKSHLLKHKGEKPYACDICDFKTYWKSALTFHKKKHSTGKSIQCDKCDFKTYTISSLNQHLRIHTGEKPFSCDKCDFRSARQHSLRRHSSMHTGNSKRGRRR